jgi:DNA polymerase I
MKNMKRKPVLERTPHAMTAPSPTSQEILVLIDGNAMIHRAFHAVPEEIATKAGETTNATYGFATMLLRILREQQPDYIAVAFDRPTPTFRHIDYKEYKAHRPAMPDHFKSQFTRVRELVAAFNIPIYEMDGFEADDVLGALSKQAMDLGIRTVIVTGDMDTMQLVTPLVTIQAARKSMSDVVIYDEAAVMERFGVTPDRIPDWKALTGDTSDNIPGVPGIGAKTATKLLQTYGTLENILEHASELPARQKQALIDGAEQARKSKWLATIVTNVPVVLDATACRTHEYDTQAVRDLFRELEFHSLISRLPKNKNSREKTPVAAANVDEEPRQIDNRVRATIGMPMPNNGAPASAVETDGFAQLALFAEEEMPPVLSEAEPLAIASEVLTNTTVIADETALAVLASSLRQAGRFSVDVETDSTNPIRADLVGISISMGHSEAYYIPVGHKKTPQGEEPSRQLDIDTIRTHLAPVMANATVRKIGHNAKYDLTVLEHFGMPVVGLDFDTMVAAYLIDPGRRGLGLKEQAFEVFGKVMTPISTLIGTGAKQITMAQAPVHAAANYAGADADMTFELMAPLEAKLRELELWDLFTKIEMPLIDVLRRMEQEGILIDPDVLVRMSTDLTEQIAALEAEIYSAVGHQFNINSTKQLGDILFNELRLPTGRKTKTGYSVDADVLENLRGAHPAVDHLLEYRTLVKLKSTYVDGLLELIDPDDRRIHTSFNQTVASSGRLSSSNPNLQNIPVRTEVGRKIRRAFIAAPGCQLLAVDYAQVELRILAHITGEPALVKAFEADEDIHRVTASRLYGIDPAAVTKDQRRMAKTVTYAIIYGQSPFGLAHTAGMTQEEARQFIQAFEASFPKVKEYVRETIQHVRLQGFVQTLLGRKRFLPNLLGMPVVQRQAAEREAINMPIQGTNADIIKLAMIHLDAALIDLELKTRMILQVHDELVFEVPDEEMDLVPELVRTHMEGAYKLSVPLRVEMKVGRNWYETEPVSDTIGQNA